MRHARHAVQKRFWFILFVFFPTLFYPARLGANPHAGEIIGVVSDSESRPLGQIHIAIYGSSMTRGGMKTDSGKDGFYRFSNLQPGEYRLEFTSEGLETFICDGIIMRAGKTVSVKVTMNLRRSTEITVVKGDSVGAD